MVEITVRKIGNSLGVILPAQAASALNVAEGDKLYLTESPDGYRISSYSPGFAEQLEVAADGIRKFKNALRELAK